jgi:hypothetical protein
MNNIGFGIFCFGDEFYYNGTINKLNNLFSIPITPIESIYR